MKRFREWFCRVVLGRTPHMWEDFGDAARPLRRWGYYELNDDGSRGVFVTPDEGIFI